MKSDRERELWLQRLADALATEQKEAAEGRGLMRPADREKVVKWGAIAVTGMTAATVISSS